MQAYIKNDINTVMKIYNKWGTLPNHLTKNKTLVTKYIKHFQQWITKTFKVDRFDFNQNSNYMAERFTPKFQQTTHILETQNHHFVMFDRTYMGLLNIFDKLKANVQLSFDINVTPQ